MRELQVGDIICVTHMFGWYNFSGQLFAMAIEHTPIEKQPDYHLLVIIAGGYGPKSVGDTFHIGGACHVSAKRGIQWHYVDDPPEYILVRIARWRLTGEML